MYHMKGRWDRLLQRKTSTDVSKKKKKERIKVKNHKTTNFIVVSYQSKNHQYKISEKK